MANTNNVWPVFTMDKRRFTDYDIRLKKMEEEAERFRELLNTPAALETAGRSTVALGALVVGMAIVIGVILSRYDNNLGILAACAGTLGVWVISTGIRKILVGRDIRRRARTAQEVLEGRDGFLWRFETLLMEWQGELPAVVGDSLRETCQASKDGVLPNQHYSLRAYWYWVAALQGRMTDVKTALEW